MFLLPPSAMWRGGPHPPAGGGTGRVALTCLICGLEAVSLVVIPGSVRVRLVVGAFFRSFTFWVTTSGGLAVVKIPAYAVGKPAKRSNEPRKRVRRWG